MAGEITVGHAESFTSEILGETRRLEIRLPAGYTDETATYPLLVVLDGGDWFRYVASIVDALAPNHLPEMIVVGLPNTDRNRDLDPIDESLGERGAGAARFQRFLAEELIPYIGSRYRTNHHRILAGHSLAGLHTLYGLLNHPETFRAFIASSPSIASQPRDSIVRLGTQAVDPSALLGRFVFITAGGHESLELHAAVQRTAEALEERSAGGLRAEWRVYPGEGHIPMKGFYEGLRTHFSDWFPPGEVFSDADWPAIDRHYRELSTRFGFSVIPPYDVVASVARRLVEAGDTVTGIAAYRAMVAAYPREELPRQLLAELEIRGLDGPYLGQHPPGLVPEPFAWFLAPGVDTKHSALAFSPDGRELYYSVHQNLGDGYLQRILVTRLQEEGWTAPRVASFSGGYEDGGPVFSPDGRRLYFYSRRPTPVTGIEPEHHEVWFVERETDGTWSTPMRLGPPIEGPGPDAVKGFLPNGDMLTTRNIDGENVLHRSSPTNDGWSEPEGITTLLYGEKFLEPTNMGDGDFYIFGVDQKTFGPWYNAYLYIAFRNDDGSWTAPKSMGDMINRGEGRFPSFSPDGRYLFFTSYRTGRAEYYWLDARIIDYLRTNDLDLVRQLTETVTEIGVSAAHSLSDELRARHGERYAFDSRLFDDVGDELIVAGLTDYAIQILQLNQESYPEQGSDMRRLKMAVLLEDEEELVRLQAVIPAGESYEDGINGMGRFLTRCGYHRAAFLAFEFILARSPRSAEAFAGMGLAFLDQGDLDRAREHLMRALELEPGNVRAARALAEMGGG